MKFNPGLHKRRSIRLKDYDYSQAGLYFLTVCVQSKACLFGDIEKDAMVLNEARQMVEKWYDKLPEKFSNTQCHEMVIMPNHFHCIIENIGSIGADPCVCPDSQPNAAHLPERSGRIEGEHTGSPLHNVVQWFKTMTTNEYIRGVKNLGWLPFDGRLWQRNYYEHIIRNAQSHQSIASYILGNPLKWQDDTLYSQK